MTKHSSVYLAWQEPETRDWHVVGALSEAVNGQYEFNYTKGALNAKKFVPFSGMEELNKSYLSNELFPLFSNRLLSSKRPEYPMFIKWLGLDESEKKPVNILARSGGMRGTDHLQMFKKIEIDSSGSFTHFFFIHGLGYLTDDAQRRVNQLSQGEKLTISHDSENNHDKNAAIVRASNPDETIGYCPRYLAKDVIELIDLSEQFTVMVETTSAEAPTNYRVLCKIEGKLKQRNINKLSENLEYQFIV